MALAGTFDAFTVLEVSTWIESVGRPGCLIAELPSGDALVWFGEGGIVAAETAQGATHEPSDVLFEVLRSGPVSWRFQSLVTPPGGHTSPVRVSACVAAIDGLVAEWNELLGLVPSLDGVVRLVEKLHSDVVLNATRWDAVRSLAAGPESVSRLFDTADDLEARRRVADLVRAGIAVVEAPPEPAPVQTRDPASVAH
jgi:hypothetical protein